MKRILPLLIILTFSLNKLFAQCTPPTISGPGIIAGTNTGTGCTDRVAVFTVANSNGATDYNWVITGTRSQTRISATQYSIVFENNDVMIEVTPTNGTCAGTKATVNITVSPTPNKPSIIQTGNSLDASVTATNYQWYLGSNAVIGATSKTFSPTTNGTYLVEAKNASGCSVFSSTFNFFRTAIKEDAIFGNFSFYPNPVTTQLFVDFSKHYQLSFYNTSGQETLQKSDLQGKQEIDLSALKRGIYLMRITSDGKTAVRKLLLK